MKNFILILSLCFSSLAWANGSVAAKAWLDIVDSGKYTESWQKSDSFFKSQITADKWNSALTSVRGPLGEVKSRTELGAKEYSSLPGVPKGEYLVIQFQTEFQNKKSATETLTLRKTGEQWLPLGYFVQ